MEHGQLFWTGYVPSLVTGHSGLLFGVRVWIGTITSGMPQGSVLGPILFLVYINDLPEKIISQICIFAGDMALYLALEGAEDSSVLQQDLDKLKNQVVPVTGSKKPISSTYKLHGEILETVTCAIVTMLLHQPGPQFKLPSWRNKSIYAIWNRDNSSTRQLIDTVFGDNSSTQLKTTHRHFLKTIHRHICLKVTGNHR